MAVPPALKRLPMHWLATVAIALAVAFDHRELAAQRDAASAHRLLLEAGGTATGEEAMAVGRLEKLVGETLWETLAEKLDRKVDEAVQKGVESLEKRDASSASELREQMKAAEQRTDAVQAEIDELKRQHARDHVERRRMQRTGSSGEAAHIIIRNTVSAAAAQRGRRRVQERRPCDGRSLPKRVAAVGIACCAPAEGGGGHRRMQADCALPTACPSEACAATFVEFYDECGGELAGELGEYTPLYESCQDMRQGSSSIAMQLGVECTENGVSDGECIPECNAEIHGYILLINIDGGDSKLSCQLHHTLYSWIGGAVRFLFFASSTSPLPFRGEQRTRILIANCSPGCAE